MRGQFSSIILARQKLQKSPQSAWCCSASTSTAAQLVVNNLIDHCYRAWALRAIFLFIIGQSMNGKDNTHFGLYKKPQIVRFWFGRIRSIISVFYACNAVTQYKFIRAKPTIGLQQNQHVYALAVDSENSNKATAVLSSRQTSRKSAYMMSKSAINIRTSSNRLA